MLSPSRGHGAPALCKPAAVTSNKPQAQVNAATIVTTADPLTEILARKDNPYPLQGNHGKNTNI